VTVCDERDREATIRTLLPMVRTIARRIARLVPGSELDDLVGDGCIGLIRAVDAYDATRGIGLVHYARRVVAGAMLNGVRRLDPVSERVRRAVRLAERDRYALAAQHGALPGEAELERRHPGLAKARLEAHRGTPLSLDAPMPPGERLTPEHRDDPAQHAVAAGERARLLSAMCSRPRRQRTIVVSHYFSERSLRAISGDLRVSPQRISQLHRAAIARIRTALVYSA
jgi:RNA polymerase sigma factor (sigma-70 family)